MIKIIMTVGIPASLKSTWARAEVAKDPLNWVRINNDDIRSMVNASVYSSDYEKGIITETRNFLIKQGLKQNKNIIIDNLNLNKRHFNVACKLAQEANKDVMVIEKAFYCELEDAIARDIKREGVAKVGEKVIEKWWKESGKEQFRHYKPRVETFAKRTVAAEGHWAPMQQNKELPKCVVYDLDGSMCLISHRNPYDASRCIDDTPHEHVVELCKLHHDTGHKIFFFSGREDKHRAMTEEWLNTHFGYPYELWMRETDNFEDDVKLKERLFNTHIDGKYNLRAWVDDRNKVCKWVYENKLPLFRVNDPEASF